MYFCLIYKSLFFREIYDIVNNMNFFGRVRQMSIISFISFCVEYYAKHTGKTSDEVYKLFKKEKLIELLDEDYGDLHGMGMEYMMYFIDEYLGVA